MSIVKPNTLLLGRGGRVLDVIDWTRAIELTYFRGDGNAVFPLSWYDTEIRSIQKAFKLPSVIMLVGGRDRFPDHDKLSLTRYHLFIRDDYTCQWCGKKINNTSGTIDHVFPLSRGGTNTWRNIVASCKNCNHEKGRLTGPEYEKRTGKKLARRPITPSRAVLFRAYIEKDEYSDWKPYLSKYLENCQ